MTSLRFFKGFGQAFLQFGLGKAQQQAHVGRAGQVRFQFADLDARLQIGTVGHYRTLSLPSRDDAVSFQFQVRALDGDDADLQLGRQLANRG